MDDIQNLKNSIQTNIIPYLKKQNITKNEFDALITNVNTILKNDTIISNLGSRGKYVDETSNDYNAVKSVFEILSKSTYNDFITNTNNINVQGIYNVFMNATDDFECPDTSSFPQFNIDGSIICSNQVCSNKNGYTFKYTNGNCTYTPNTNTNLQQSIQTSNYTVWTLIILLIILSIVFIYSYY
jgi:hypothetical protein